MVGRSCMASFSRAETLALSRFAIDCATSVSIANTSFKSRSYSSAQIPASVRVSTNCAFTCTLPPERRTVPSSTCETRSALPICRTSCLPRYCMTLVRLITLRSAIFASLVKMSSWTPSAKNACSFSSLRFSNGSTAMPVVTGCRMNSLFQTIQPAAAARATSDAANSALVGFRRTHFLPRVRIPVRRARIGSCFSQRSRSSASARAEE